MKTITIDRKLWSRGSLDDVNLLLITKKDAADQDGERPLVAGRMCCLGFMCLQMGATPKQITGCSAPSTVIEKHPKLAGKLAKLATPLNHPGVAINTTFSDEAIGINDDPDITSHEREEQLIALGKKHGLKIEFI